MRKLAVCVLILISSLAQSNEITIKNAPAEHITVPHDTALQTQALQELELLSYRLSSSFATFIFFEGQQEYLQQAKQHLARGSELLKTISAEYQTIHEKWHHAEQFIADNTNRTFAGSDMTLEAGWSLLTLDLQESIAAENASSNIENSQSNNAQIAFRLQLNLEQILVHYMKFANSTAGGYGVSRARDTIENKVDRAELLILQHYKNNKRLQRKWKYIKKTILAYNSNTAPYIVMRVFDNMRANIRNSRPFIQQLAAD